MGIEYKTSEYKTSTEKESKLKTQYTEKHILTKTSGVFSDVSKNKNCIGSSNKSWENLVN